MIFGVSFIPSYPIIYQAEASEPIKPVIKPLEAPTLKVEVESDEWGDCEKYRPIFAKFDWDIERMLKVCECESGGNPNAENLKAPDNSHGLLQINLHGELAKERPSEQELRNPEKNIEFGYKIYKGQGYRAWKICANII